MKTINEEAASGVKLKVVSTLYYPGFTADDVSTRCKDAKTNKPVNQRAKFLPYLVRSNWRTCHFAEQQGFACADTFAGFMAADYDSNGDGQIDREALRYRLALRASSKPQATDRPACPMLSGLRALELHYRHNSECRGGRQGWE